MARNTVRKYLRRLMELGIGVEELLKLDDSELSDKCIAKAALEVGVAVGIVEVIF